MHSAERLWPKSEPVLAAHSAPLDQSSPLQQFDVFGDRVERHVERCGQFGDSGLALGKTSEHRTTLRVGERDECMVQCFGGLGVCYIQPIG